MTVRVEFSGIVKRFGRRRVLSGIAGELGPSRVVVVTGSNGSGKSTLLNIIAGVLRPSAGSLRYHDGQGDLPRARWSEVLGVAAPDMAV